MFSSRVSHIQVDSTDASGSLLNHSLPVSVKTTRKLFEKLKLDVKMRAWYGPSGMVWATSYLANGTAAMIVDANGLVVSCHILFSILSLYAPSGRCRPS